MPKTKKEFEKIRKKSRQLIIDKAMQLFAEKGFQNTTISNIAEEADISKGLLYHYFDSKDKLLKEIINKSFREIDEFMNINQSNAEPYDRLTKFIDVFFNSLKEKRNVWKLYSKIMLQPGMSAKFQEMTNYYTNTFRPLVKSLYPGLSAKEIELETIILGIFIDGLIYNYVIAPDAFPLHEIKDKLIKRLLIK